MSGEQKKFKNLKTPSTTENQFLQKTFYSRVHFNVANLQTKLKVSQPNDIYEREADIIAEKVMDMADPKFSIPTSSDKRINSTCKNCDEEKVKISRIEFQMTNGTPGSNNIAGSIDDAIQQGGSPVDTTTRQFMESRFNYDFGNARIHSDKRAEESAHSLNALAYTLGNNIVFGKGNYNPTTSDGRRLLAHELTHLIQQNGAAHRYTNHNDISFQQVQRQWSDATSARGRSDVTTRPGSSWNRGESAVGSIRRIPIEGLTQGNQEPSMSDRDKKRVSTTEAAGNQRNGRAVILIPNNLNMSRPIEVLLHFHGFNIGYRQRKDGDSSGTVRDVEVDRIEQQLQQGGRPMIAVLPQGTTTSGFGSIFNSNDYIRDVFSVLGRMGIWGSNSPPDVQRVVLSGHSGAGGLISQMLSGQNQPRLPSALNELVLFDAINGEGELTAVTSWVIEHLKLDLAQLRRFQNDSDRLQYLNQSMRFRSYYSGRGYKERNIRLQSSIKDWFRQNSAVTSAMGQDVVKLLHHKYEILQSTTRVHDQIVGAGSLQDAIGALPSAPPSNVIVQPKLSTSQSIPIPTVTSRVQESNNTNQLVQREVEDEDRIHVPLIENYRRWHSLPRGGIDEFGSRVGPSDSQIKYGEHRDLSLTQPQIEQRMINKVVNFSHDRSSLLPANYIRVALEGKRGNLELQQAFNAEVQRVGQGTFEIQMQQIEAASHSIIRLLERQFVDDPRLSTLDLLPSDQRQRHRNFAWNQYDYPGGPPGPNESRAREMIRALNEIRPERRVNQGKNAVVTESQYTPPMQRYILAELQNVPDFRSINQAKLGMARSLPHQPAGQRLNQYALRDYLRMRDAALQDGVVLIAFDSYRSPSRAAANAARSGNPQAVASFSPHMLGLAIDLQMSYTMETSTGTTISHHYAEATTNPMQNVIDMRQSPVHKWMFVRGELFGWYPYQNEPWHWEYNPPGLRQQFLNGFNSSTRTE